MSLRHATSVTFLVFSLVVAAFAGTGCPGPDYPKCEKDDQCKKNKDGKDINEYCLFGQCQECAKDTNCDAGERCNRGRCEKTCDSDAVCGVGQMCEERACVPVQCSDAKPCGGGQACTAGRCTAPTAAVAPAATDQSLDCQKHTTVQFDYNASDLRPDGVAVLDHFAKCLSQNIDWKVTVEGHCDERGTTDYNLQLGERRAATVRDHLARLGVDKNRLRVLSYGKEKPVDNSGTESGWAKNRRGELVVQ